MKVPTAVTIAAALLTALTWSFFYVSTPKAPLTGAGTTVVAVFWLVVLFVSRWVWNRLRQKKG
jgi:hypothetical protein